LSPEGRGTRGATCIVSRYPMGLEHPMSHLPALNLIALLAACTSLSDDQETGGDASDTAATSDGGSVADGGSDGGSGDSGSGDSGSSDGGGGDTGEAVAGKNAVPDFSLPDLNPTSSRYGEAVSPRDYLEQVSGWYFIHAT
jgi:hypothetical protein